MSESWKNLGQRTARVLARGYRGQLHIRMRKQQTHQFLAGIAGSANDGDSFGRIVRLQKLRGSIRDFYRLLYWKRLRAPGWPYFLRSRIRGSRVRKPSALSKGRKLASTVNNARARLWRTAVAWPLGPHPATVICASYLPAMPVTLRCCVAVLRWASILKYVSKFRPLMIILPVPVTRRTRANAVL